MKKLFRMDFTILMCSILLTGIGLFTLYSLTFTQISSQAFFKKEFTNQLIFAATGLLLFGITFSLPPIYFRFKLFLGVLFIMTLGMLLFTYFFGTNVNGARRWITLPGGLTLQPSEFTKISIIIISAALLSIPVYIRDERKEKLGKIKLFLLMNRYILLALALCLLLIGIILIQPSLTVSFVLLIILGTILFANIKNKALAILSILTFLIAITASQKLFFEIPFFVRILMLLFPVFVYAFSVYTHKVNDIVVFLVVAAGLVIGAVGIPYIWNNVLQEFQRGRIEAFFEAREDTRDSSAAGYQQEQAKIAAGAGQFYGHGFKQVSDSVIASLPESTTDFVFAIFSFKFGFVGSAIVILLYLVLILRIFYLADHMNDRFSALILTGVGGMILIQFFWSIGMNLDFLPVGGITLPFVSAGGSSLLSMMIATALVQNIIATNKLEKNNYRKGDKIVIQGWNG